jgi:hypothetical protein
LVDMFLLFGCGFAPDYELRESSLSRIAIQDVQTW